MKTEKLMIEAAKRLLQVMVVVMRLIIVAPGIMNAASISMVSYAIFSIN